MLGAAEKYPEVITLRMPPPKGFSKAARGVIYVLLLIALALAAAAAYYYTSLLSLQAHLLPHPQTFTLLQSGEVLSSIYSYQDYAFTIPPKATNSSLAGSYYSLQRVASMIMTAQQFQDFSGGQNSTIVALYSYAYGTSAEINATLGPGSYYLVFYNQNIVAPTTVTITNPVVVRYTSNLTAVE